MAPTALRSGPFVRPGDASRRTSSEPDVEERPARSTYVRESNHEQPVGVIEMPRFMGFVRMEENIGAPPQ
jgi:hypothetical protein